MLTRCTRPAGVLMVAAALAIGGCGGTQPTPPASADKAGTVKQTTDSPGKELPAVSSPDSPPVVAASQPSGSAPSPAAPQTPATGAGGGTVPPPQLQPILVETKIVTDKYDDGKPKRQVKVSVYTGVPERYDGEFQEWHPNGKLWKQGNYKDDLREGSWKFWHENATLAKSGDYKAGKMEGEWICQRADGTKTREEHWSAGRRDGVWKHYDDTGIRVIQQQQYKQNTPDGTWTTWHPNRQKATVEVYLEGQRHGTQSSWYEDGKPRVSVEFRNGRQHGKLIRWDPSGKKIEERVFRDGEQVDN